MVTNQSDLLALRLINQVCPCLSEELFCFFVSSVWDFKLKGLAVISPSVTEIEK